MLVNDFGSINIDSRLIVSRDANVITLENGCVCCSVRADLVAQLTALLEGPAAPGARADRDERGCGSGPAPGRASRSPPPQPRAGRRRDHARRRRRHRHDSGVGAGARTAAARERRPDRLQQDRPRLARATLAALRERLTYPRARVVEASYGGRPARARARSRRRRAEPGADGPDGSGPPRPQRPVRDVDLDVVPAARVRGGARRAGLASERRLPGERLRPPRRGA